MVAPRHFGGSRSGGRIGAASQMMRLEILKKGKLPPAERYKRIMKKKLEENKEKALGSAYKKPFSLSDKINIKKLSPRAEQAMKEIAMRKARKLAKAERKMVIVQPRHFHNGSINKKGEIFDIAGNIIGKVNTKNGVISTNSGWGIGKYKPKSMMTDNLIIDAINKHSPYFIQQRRLQMLQAQGVMEYGVHGGVNGDVINVHGATPAQIYAASMMHQDNNFDDTSSTLSALPRQNIGVTSWGVMSNNVHGTFADNAWGTAGDNVWGTYNTDVWGGAGGGLWSSGVKLWGTGNGTNYLKPITNAIRGFFAAVFGITSRRNRESLRQMNALASAYRNSANAASGQAGGAPSQAGRRR